MKHAQLEVCVDDARGLRTAITGRADRIELCASLATGGLTPSPGLILLAKDAPIPVRMMIRPRGGDFVYDQTDITQMIAEIDAAKSAGFDGVVLGASSFDGRLDRETLRILRARARPLKATLHRAVDLLDHVNDAVKVAIELGFDTILSSGGALSAHQGIAALASMNAIARNRVTVMPGAGVNTGNAAEILRATGAVWLHSSCSKLTKMPDLLHSRGFCPSEAAQTDRDTIGSLAALCHGFTISQNGTAPV